jgi:hypothetical protein
MGFPTSLKQLCMPAFIYFMVSIITYIIIFLQNIFMPSHTMLMTEGRMYHLGVHSCFMSSFMYLLVFIIQLIYILFWTWVLNLICKDGHSGISWILVLLPFLLFFVLMGLVMTNI